jgi:hypothetical protein
MIQAPSNAKLKKYAEDFERKKLVEPASRWFVTATGVPGFGPNTNGLESKNNDYQKKAILGNKPSREYLLKHGVAHMFIEA